jgi:hypothetical protein
MLRFVKDKKWENNRNERQVGGGCTAYLTYYEPNVTHYITALAVAVLTLQGLYFI